MRYLYGLICVCALGVVPAVGCAEGGDPCVGVRCDDNNECTGDTCVGGVCQFAPVADGTACADNDDDECTAAVCASGVCEGTPVEDGTACDDGIECTAAVCASGVCEGTPVEDGTACDDGNECTTAMCASGVCEGTPVEDGAACGEGAGACQEGSCVGTFACTERGIRDAIAVGGGPHTFDCNGPQSVVTQSEIVIEKDVILDGEGNLIVDGNEHHRVLSLPPGVTVALQGFTVTRGHIRDGNGGGIATGGTLRLVNCTVSANTAELPSGSWLIRGTGGGIYNTGELTVTKSTVSGNVALGIWRTSGICIPGPCPPSFYGGKGGAIDSQGGTVTLTNSTLSGNYAEDYGGGIANRGGAMVVINSTISENTAARSAGAIRSYGTLALTNTLVKGDCAGAMTSNGYNIENPGNTCGFDQSTDMPGMSADDLKLGDLADNGGPTKTHALEAGSEATDKIPAVDCEVDEDQRGEPRPAGTTDPKLCDVGAFEVQP